MDEIREAYLKWLDEKEYRNLMRLASLGELEIALPKEALVDQKAAFDVASRRLGLVFHEKVGAQQQYVCYRLAHSALGRLLLCASYEKVNAQNEQKLIAEASPVCGGIYGALHKIVNLVKLCLRIPVRLMPV